MLRVVALIACCYVRALALVAPSLKKACAPLRAVEPRVAAALERASAEELLNVEKRGLPVVFDEDVIAEAQVRNSQLRNEIRRSWRRRAMTQISIRAWT